MATKTECERPRKAVVVMFDTLCRHFLPTYSEAAHWVHAPNFERLAERTVTFDSAYVGSMPCMPARREMHTGRYNFLHREWGPLEPFDESLPELLRARPTEVGGPVHAHLCTDHAHYWEDGGATYHQRFSTFEFVRGQEGDKWRGVVDGPDIPEDPSALYPNFIRRSPMHLQDRVNREFVTRLADMPQHITFSKGLEFIERNASSRSEWFLQIETFDPHEPFFSPEEFQALYPDDWDGPEFDWPPYHPVIESEAAVQHVRRLYASLVAVCDAMLGRVLDAFDKHGLWADTMLIVNTDHGLLMGEHNWWAKTINPWFQEVAHIPMWIHDPRHAQLAGQRRAALVQTIDICPTLLNWFRMPPPPTVEGANLADVLQSPEAVAHPHGGLFGVFGGQVNIVDPTARFVYMRGCKHGSNNEPLLQYTLFPTIMRGFFSESQLGGWHAHPGFSFSKGMRLMEVPGRNPRKSLQPTLLYDVKNDPGQQHPLGPEAKHIEHKLIAAMVRLMAANDAPSTQFVRLGLPHPSTMTSESVARAGVLGTSQGEIDRARNADGEASKSRMLNLLQANNLKVYGPKMIKSNL